MGKRRFSFYVIKGGNKPGLYESWEECDKAWKTQKGGRLKGFNKKKDAEEFLLVKPKNYYDAVAYTSGSYNYYTEHYGWCGLLIYKGTKYTIKGSNNDLNLIKSWAIAGKVRGVEETIKKALQLNIKSLLIYQDLELIEKLHSGEFKPSAAISERLIKFFKSVKDRIEIQFEHKNKLDDNAFVKESYNTARDVVGLKGID